MANELGIKRITPSMIGQYKKCPKAFYYSSWLGLKLPQTMRHLEFGTAFHAALDNIYEQYDNADGWSLADFSIAKKQFTDKFTEKSVDILEFQQKAYKYPDPVAAQKETYETMLADGIAMLKEYWDRKEELRANHGIDPKEFELIMKIPVHNPDTQEILEIPMSGRLDAISADESIVEFKTSSAKYDPIETRSLPQSLSYNLLHYCKYGRLPKRLSYVVIIKGRKKSGDRIQVLSYEYDKADIATFFEEVKAILSKIRNREFDKPLKNHDRWCDCQKFEEALKIN